MTRTLQPGDQLDRYRIVGPLGAGGMGEVYRAHDGVLERDVALKVLPVQLVRSAERVRRFVLEAKSASSLNHPNIVTIYEIGEAAVQGAGEAGSPVAAGGAEAAVHYISMELVAGETLGEKIHEERTDLKTLLGWLAQAAEGVAKAHAAGIVHRDLKPGNIMVSHDGYAKVLDFGLAKLTEKAGADPALSSAPTEVGGATTAGVLMGTVGYMSPEQVQAKPVDHRTDIFSFGCILYEAAARRRPFSAESSIETMHRILHDKPAPVEEANPAVPTELRRLIRRCLAKSPDQRFQSMKDVAIELRDIVDEYESLSASTSSASGASHAALGERPATKSRFPLVPVVVAALAVGLGGLALGIWGLKRGDSAATDSPAAAIRLSTLTSRGDLNDAVLSRDGRYLGYVAQGTEAPASIRVRQVATGSDVEVLGPTAPPPFGLEFTPDGNYLLYLAADPERGGYKALYQVPSLGGTPVKLLYDIDGAPSFSPDGKRVAFWRGYPQDQLAKIMIFDLEARRESEMAVLRQPESITGDLAWSPDGEHVAAVLTGVDRLRMEIGLFRTSDGGRTSFRSAAVPEIGRLAWTPDSKGLYTSFLDVDGAPRSQLARVLLSDGRFRRITSGFDAYTTVSAADDGAVLSALRIVTVENLWTVSADGSAPPRPLTHSSGGGNSVFNPRGLPGGDIVYVLAQEDGDHLYRAAPDGSQARALTTGRGYVINYRVDGSRVVYQRIGDDLIPHLYSLDLDTGVSRQLTEGGGELLADVSPTDGSILYYRQEVPGDLLVMDREGRNTRKLASSFERFAEVSPDGTRCLYAALVERNGSVEFGSALVPFSGGASRDLDIPASLEPEGWSPDGRHVSALDRQDPRANVVLIDVETAATRRVTSFEEGRIEGHAWSPDGSRLLVAQRKGPAVNLLVVDPASGRATPLTNFPTGTLFSAEWAPDGTTILFCYGSRTRDAVLIRDLPS
jgi:serine/threonine protein kinase/Tol biopolymer transport system component